MLGPAQPGKHEADHRQIDHRFTSMSLAFVVAIEPAVAAEPPEGALHDPASRKDFELVEVGTFYNLNGATPQFPGVVQQTPGITAVSPNVFDPSARRFREERCEQLLGSVAILNVGRQHHDPQDQSDCVDHNMPLATVDLLACIEAPLVAALGALNTLTVDDTRAGIAVSSFDQADLFAQVRVNRRPQPVPLPETEVVINSAPPGEMNRQVAPLASRLDQIEDRVKQFADFMLAGTANLTGFWEAVADEIPFGIGKVRGVAHPYFVKCCSATYNLFLEKSSPYQTGS